MNGMMRSWGTAFAGWGAALLALVALWVAATGLGWAQSATPPMATEAPARVVASTAAPLPVVSVLDLQRYSGDWYEIARLPNWFQRQCAGQVRARYGMAPSGLVSVLNQCRRADGSLISAQGEARRVPRPGQPEAGQLEVRFAPAWLGWLPLVWGDYHVIALDDAYRTALVGAPNRDYLWLLSRQPTMADAEVAAWLDKARALGFPTDRVVRTPATPAVDPP